jgi:hypothetical protein
VVTMGVTSGFATIRLVGVVPMPHYLMFPAFMVILFGGTFVLFPYAVKVNNMLKVILRYWAEELDVLVPKDQLKYAKRVVKGTKVGAIAVLLGDYRFAVFDSGCITECYWWSLEYLITACLEV